MSEHKVPFHHSLGTRSLLFAVVPTVAILLGIIVYTSARMSQAVRDEAEVYLQGLARQVASEVERSNARAVLAAQVMAASQESAGLFGRREESVEYARSVLASHPEFTGAYFGYEPDADGQDARYREAGSDSPMARAHDEAGRFLPYWYRGLQDNSQILLTPLIDMETSLYYQGVKEQYLARGRGHSMVTEPYVYEGKLIVEHTHPVVIDGQFKGIAGIDRALTDIGRFIGEIEERAGMDIFLISRTGRFIATTTPDEADLITKEVGATPYGGLFGSFVADRAQDFFELARDPALGEFHYYATASVPTGEWMVVVREPEADVAAPIRENVLYDLLIAAAGLVVVVALSLWTTRSITRRVGMAVGAADTIASGDLASQVELETGGRDEVALLMGSLGRMAQSLEAKMQAIDRMAEGNYAVQVMAQSERDALGRSLQGMAANLRQIVEHAGRIAEGDYSRLLEPRSEADELTQSLNRMTQSLVEARDQLEQRVQHRTDELQEYAGQLEARGQELQRLTEESQAQAAEDSSLAALAAQLQGNLAVEEVAQRALDEMARFLAVPMGALYVPGEDGRLHRRASHALPAKAQSTASFRPGSGSVGQAAQSRQKTTLAATADTWSIPFGLTQVTPKLVVTLPLVANEALAGVVELYLLEELSEAQARWLDRAGEAAAAALRLAAESGEREAAEERTRLILESSGEALFGLDAEGRATFVNPAACAMLGYEPEELVGEATHALVHHSHPDGSPYPVEGCPMRQAFTEGVVTRVDDEVLWHKDGHAISVEYTSTPIVKDGQILGAVISCRDVTEARRAQEALRSSQRQLQDIIDTMPGIVLTKDLEGRYVTANRLFEEAHGVRVEDALGRTDHGILPDDMTRHHEAVNSEVIATGEVRSFEEEITHPDGTVRSYQTTKVPLRDADGVIYGICGLKTDITARKETEAAARASQERLASLFEALPVGVVMIDPAGSIVQANGLTEEILGVSADAHRMRDLQSEEWRIVREDGSPMPVEEYPASRALAGEGEVHDVIMGVHRPQGDVVWISASASPIAADAGGGVAVAFENITERRMRERRDQLLGQLREAVWQLDAGSAVTDILEPLRSVLEDSGVPYRALGVNLIESERDERVRTFTAGAGGYREVILEPVYAAKVMELWRGGGVANRRDLWAEDDLKELEAWDSDRGPRSIVDVPFSHGTLAANSQEADAFTPHLDLLADIAGVLSEGFRRLDDLQART